MFKKVLIVGGITALSVCGYRQFTKFNDEIEIDGINLNDKYRYLAPAIGIEDTKGRMYRLETWNPFNDFGEKIIVGDTYSVEGHGIDIDGYPTRVITGIKPILEKIDSQQMNTKVDSQVIDNYVKE